MIDYVAVVLLLASAVMFVLGIRARRQDRRKDERIEDLEALMSDHLALASDRETQSVELASRLREAVMEAQEQESRALSYFDCIARIEEQREYWRKHYHDQARSHSVAQGMLLQEIHRLAMRLHAYQQQEKHKLTPISPGLSEIYENFVREYVDPGTAHADPPADPPRPS